MSGDVRVLCRVEAHGSWRMRGDAATERGAPASPKRRPQASPFSLFGDRGAPANFAAHGLAVRPGAHRHALAQSNPIVCFSALLASQEGAMETYCT